MNRLDSRTSQRNWKTAWITLVGAVIGLVLTFVGGVLPLIRDVTDRDTAIAKRDNQIRSLTEQQKSAEVTHETDQEIIASLKQENTELRAAVPYTVAADAEHSVRAADTLSLAKNGDTIDLNSTLPHFRAVEHPWTDTLRYDGESVVLGYGPSVLTLKQGVASYKTCEESPESWQETSHLDPHNLTSPTTCIRLESKRYATVQVVQYDEVSANLIITVWD